MLKNIDANPKAFAIFYGAIGSILASIIWALAPALKDWLGNSTVGILVDFVNHRYIRAATLEPVNYAFFMLTVALAVSAALWFEIAATIRRRHLEADSDTPLRSEPPKRAKRLVYVAVNLTVSGYLLYGFFQVAGEVIVLNAITDFKQHIRIITPYITQAEKDNLLSDWSQMRTIDDYNNIYKRMTGIAQQSNVKLYRNRMY